MVANEKFQIEKAREHLVVKDNRLIQDVRRRKYELSTLEQKVLGFIISLIKPPKNGSEPEYSIEFDIRMFSKVCGITINSGKNYENIKRALQKLAQNTFWIQEGSDELLFQWIVTPRIKKQSGRVVIRFSPDVLPYLYNLQEKFTQYELYQILALKSSYSISLYELFKSYSFKKEFTVTIDNLKHYLSIDGKYQEYKALRRKVIEPAITEINQFTDIEIEWEPNRIGRRYESITFKIHKKKSLEGFQAYQRTMAVINGKPVTVV